MKKKGFIASVISHRYVYLTFYSSFAEHSRKIKQYWYTFLKFYNIFNNASK